MALLLLTFALLIGRSFAFFTKFQNSRSAVAIAESSWQEDLDKFLDLETEWNSRPGIATELIQKARDIGNDLVTAFQEKDVSKVAPPSLKYGKAVVGMQAVRRQIVTDIIPDLISKGLPKIVESGPKVVNQIIKATPSTVQDIFSSAKEITQDASALQSTVEDVKKELKNIVSSTPEGFFTPSYQVEKKTSSYEIRKYSPYSVYSTAEVGDVTKSTDADVMDLFESSAGLVNLAGYMLGKNSESKKFSMTTPVIMNSGSMEFILPDDFTSESAPFPSSPDVVLKDVPGETLAVLEFPGLATAGEVSRQRALLEDGLLAANIEYDNLSFKVFQYNPPYTLPWLRRNEVTLKVVGAYPVDRVDRVDDAFQ